MAMGASSATLMPTLLPRAQAPIRGEGGPATDGDEDRVSPHGQGMCPVNTVPWDTDLCRMLRPSKVLKHSLAGVKLKSKLRTPGVEGDA